MMVQSRHNSAGRRRQSILFRLGVTFFLISVHVHAIRPAFIASTLPKTLQPRGITKLFGSATSSHETNAKKNGSSNYCSISTKRITTASGKPVCRYALGGAARSVQPESLPLTYRDMLSEHDGEAAPFYFYYNPHRYPLFLSGVADSFRYDKSDANNHDREDVFLASGGTDRSPAELDQRLNDALVFSGGDYLDAFVIEYVCDYELSSDNRLDEELQQAIGHLHKMKKEGKIRYVIASTHSHAVGSVLASAKLPDGNTPAFDGLMLRYSMSHKIAAESLSLQSALEHKIPVWAFTTTRWNRLQSDPPTKTDFLPTTADCIKFALDHPAIEIVLHSAQDDDELEEALAPLLSTSTSGQSSWLLKDEMECWRAYGNDEVAWNGDDSFDEYPEESVE